VVWEGGYVVLEVVVLREVGFVFDLAAEATARDALGEGAEVV